MPDLHISSQDPGTYPEEPIFGSNELQEAIAGDYSIWLHMDGIKSTTMPWKLGDYGSRGVFSKDEIAELAKRHGFTRKQIRKLSKHIGFCLDRESVVNLVRVQRSMAEARARKRTKMAHNAAKRGEFAKAAALIADLVDHFACETRTSSALEEAQRLGAADVIEKKAYVEALRELRKTPDAAFEMSPVNASSAWDDRRKHVVWECCYFFLETGRPVTYMPTDDSPHGGRLADLIQDVVRRVTKNSLTLSPGTIRRDIDMFKNPDPTVFHGDDPRAVYLS